MKHRLPASFLKSLALISVGAILCARQPAAAAIVGGLLPWRLDAGSYRK